MKKRKFLSLALALVLGLSLPGCANNASKAESEKGSAAAGETKAEEAGGEKAEASEGVKEMKLPTFLAGENVGAKFFLPQVERFNKKYEGKYKITVEEVVQDSYAEKIKQLATQKKLPALVHSPGSGGIDAQWFKQVILDNDLAYDLTDFAKETPELSELWLPESKEYCTYNGKLVVSPMLVIRPIGMFYNEDLYKPEKALGELSYEEFVSSLGDNKIAFMTSENAWTSALMLSALVGNEEGGAKLLQDSVKDKLWDYTEEPFVKGVEKLQTLLQKNASANTLGAAYADAANAFMSNKAAVIPNGSWMVSEFNEESKDKWSNDFKGSSVHAGIYPGNIALANPAGYGDFWIPATASDEEKEVAKAFLAFRGSQEELEAYLLAEGGTAPRLKYSEDFLNKLQESRLLYEYNQSVNDDTKYVPILGDVFPASIGDQEFGKLLPKLIDGSLSPEEFCKELTKKAEEAKQ